MQHIKRYRGPLCGNLFSLFLEESYKHCHDSSIGEDRVPASITTLDQSLTST